MYIRSENVYLWILNISNKFGLKFTWNVEQTRNHVRKAYLDCDDIVIKSRDF